MSDSPPAEAPAIHQYAPIVASSAWPVALLAADGRIVAASAAAWELLGDGERSAPGWLLEDYLVPGDRGRLRELLHEALATERPVGAAVSVARDECPQATEIELWPILDLGAPLVTTLLYKQSAEFRRNQLVLACNLLAPRLLRAPSPQAVYREVAETLQRLGFGVAVFELDAEAGVLRIVLDTSAPEVYELLRDSVSPAAGDGGIPASVPVLGDVLASRRALYHPNPSEMLSLLYPPEAVAQIRAVQQLTGLRGYTYAPLIAGDALRGILNVWGPNLDHADVPFIEAFAHQIGAALGQIELRQAMERQIDRLSSLATTAHAVTSLGALEDVLQVVCLQARKLLGADSATLALPAADRRELEVRTSVGVRPARIGVRLPLEGSLTGLVWTTGRGMCVPNVQDDPRAYGVLRGADAIHSVIFHPLIHHGEVLGVLSVGHHRPGHFSSADLDYLGRYAEYAALAIVNARLYREAESTRRYLDAIIRNAPDAMLVVRPDLTLHPLNAAPAHTFGYASSDIEGRAFLDFVPPEHHEEALAHWQAALRGETRRFELELMRVSGKRYSALVSLNAIPGYDEVLASVRDITDLRRLEADVRQSEKLAALGRLVAGAAHELNNPLAVILGLTQLQLEEELPEGTRHDMRGIERAALRAAAIIQQLRLFARPQPLVPQPVELRDVTTDALDQLRAPIEAAGVEVTTEFPDEPLLASGEPHQLEQVLVNLLQNAVQAVASGPPGAPRAITVCGWAEPDGVRLAVRDTGPGISAAHMQRLFEPFFTTREVGQGLGLGLALVHALVQQHGGAVRVESEPGRGTVFEVRLPAAQQAPLAEPPTAPALPAGLRILLAEDEELVRAVAERALRRMRCAVDAVGSGEEALALAQEQDYDLVVSDIQMPGVDGQALYERLRARRPDLRWLMITGDTMGERSRDFLEQTGLNVLPKPFTTTQLVQSVAACLEASPARADRP